MGKLVEKVVAEEFSQFCKTYLKLHKDQMVAQKSRCAINAIAIMLDSIYKIWDHKNMVETLLMDVKGAFDYVSRLKLV